MKKRCLIVDDIPEYTHTLEFYLEEHFIMDKAYSYEDAVKLLENNRYDLVITDVRLKETDGNKEGLKIVEIAKNKNIPAIVISGYRNLGYAVEAISKGADYFIEKPIDIDEFIKIVEKISKNM
ncbi:response regulator [Persephonella sp.]